MNNTINYIKSVFKKLKVGFTDPCTGEMFHSCSGDMMGYCNQLQSQSFQKNDCTNGKTGSNVDYVVPSGKYCMLPTLAEANNLALQDILANGQSYANSNGVCTCEPCMFKPTVYDCTVPSTDPTYYDHHLDLPLTHLGLPAISVSGGFPSSCASSPSFQFKIRGVKNEVFVSTPMSWSGVGFGVTGIESDTLSTCDGGLGAKQANHRVVLKSSITQPELITATFNVPSCGGIQTVSFYVLPATTQTYNIPTVGVSCPVTYPVNYNGNSYNSESSLVSAVQADYPTFSIIYDNTTCIYTFTGSGTPPANISLSHLTGVPVPVVGRGCPIQYPAYWSSDLISDETDLINTVAFVYSLQGFTVTYDSPTCTFYFDGPGTPPANITLYTPVPVIGTPNNCSNLYNMDNPVVYNGNTYNSKSAFIAAVQADYPTFTVTDGGDGSFHFLGQGTPPASISAAFTNYSITNTDYGTLIITWSLTGTTITGNFIWTGTSGPINWVLQDLVSTHGSGTTSPGTLVSFSTTITIPSGSNGLLQLVVNNNVGNQVATCIAYLP